MTWIEQDQHDFLLAHRNPSFPKAPSFVSSLPSLPVKPGRFSAVVAMSVFNILPPEDLGASVAAMNRALEPGGHLVHVQDLASGIWREAQMALDHGMVVAPYFETDSNPLSDTIGLYWMDTTGLREALQPYADLAEIKVLQRVLDKYPGDLKMISTAFREMCLNPNLTLPARTPGHRVFSRACPPPDSLPLRENDGRHRVCVEGQRICDRFCRRG